jgi:hydrogenase maturation protease
MNALVAGFGNVFRSDDGLGCSVVRMLSEAELGESVRLRDFGTSGMQLALDMLDEYDLVVIVDALRRDAPPGTVFAIECDQRELDAGHTLDAHAMTMDAVLALYRRLHAQSGITHVPRIVVVGCVPENLNDGMDLSEPVRAALPACADLVRKLTSSYFAAGAQS